LGVAVVPGTPTTTLTSTTSTTTTTTLPSLCDPTPQTGCQPALGGKSKLTLKNSATDAKDRLAWSWVSSAAVSDAEFADPVTGTNDYALCVYDAGGRRLDATAPAGGTCGTKPCWKRTTSSFVYADKLLDPDGLLRIVLKPGAAGNARIAVKGKRGTLGMPVLPLTTPVRVQLLRGFTPTCWEATFTATTRNDSEVLKARSDP
jgi:hypothetical protein